MSHEDLVYYRQRAEREAEMAERARHPNAVRAHALLAGHYRDMVDRGGAALPAASDRRLKVVR